MSYLVHKHWPCKANLRWTDVQQGCRADKKWKWAAASGSSFNVHILEMFIWFTYIIHIYSIYIYLYLFFYVQLIFHHILKGPEQDQLRNPFVPYVRNSAERSIHNFDSLPVWSRGLLHRLEVWEKHGWLDGASARVGCQEEATWQNLMRGFTSDWN